MSKVLLLLVALLALPGCNTIKNLAQIPLVYTPTLPTVPRLPAKTFTLDVKDARLYVTSGGKAPSYVGVARSSFGIPHDVFIAKKIALDKQLKTDLRKELEALGLVDSPASGAKRIAVRVRDLNSDAYLKGHFTYDIEIRVANAAGQQLAVNQVKGEKFFDTKIMDSGESALQRQIPIYYEQIIRELVREDPRMLFALENDL